MGTAGADTWEVQRNDDTAVTASGGEASRFQCELTRESDPRSGLLLPRIRVCADRFRRGSVRVLENVEALATPATRCHPGGGTLNRKHTILERVFARKEYFVILNIKHPYRIQYGIGRYSSEYLKLPNIRTCLALRHRVVMVIVAESN